MGDNIKTKVFITGASGLLGRMIMAESMKQNFETVGIAFSRAHGPLMKCDLTKPGEVEKLIEEVKPTVIVHSAAEKSPDKVDQDYEGTKVLNIDASKRLARIAKKIGSKIIYVSTDYVFDGKSPPFKATDTPNPTNKYGETKYEGEKAMLEENPDVCILRIPVLYGPVESLSESAVTCLVSSLFSNKEKSISHYEQRYPSHTRDIARIILSLIQSLQKDPGLKGVFQWSGKEKFTKYEMVQAIAQVFSLPSDHIKPDPNQSQGAPRPYDALMDTSALENLGISFHTKFEDGVKESLEKWVDDHRKAAAI